MGDVGDYWNEHRSFKRAQRAYWVECPSASCQFGGNPVKVPPGGNCRHCGWKATGERGSDTRKADHDLWEAEHRRIEAEQKKEAKRLQRTCRWCKRLFNTSGGRADHERSVHKNRMHEVPP